MTKRSFVLPNIEDLTKDQERARLLPIEGCHLVIGGPGTGKSVVALLRARRLHRLTEDGQRQRQNYVFLVYNRLLLAASLELMSREVNAHPWITWFKRTYKNVLQVNCPVHSNQAWNLDWQAIDQSIGEIDSDLDISPQYLVVDEGQDMPVHFYAALANLDFEHFFVVADENQRITEQKSKFSEIEQALDIDIQDRVLLKENFRNTQPIARLAHCFRVKNDGSPPQEFSQQERSSRIPVLIDYGEGCEWGFSDLITRVLIAADRNPARLFGIITPDNDTRTRWLSALQKSQVVLDNGMPRIVTYASGEDDSDLSFAEGGLYVINAQSAKGLEFDSVILADIHHYRFNPENKDHMDDMKRRLYVLVSRARERIVLLREIGRPCPVEAILPADPEILSRRGIR